MLSVRYVQSSYRVCVQIDCLLAVFGFCVNHFKTLCSAMKDRAAKLMPFWVS